MSLISLPYTRPVLMSLALALSAGLAAPAISADAPMTGMAGMAMPGHNSPEVAEAMTTAALAAPDRTKEMRDRDEGRRPEVLFAAAHTLKGYNVIDLGAGSGYMSMILSSFVGPEGHVDAQNPKMFVENFKLGPVMDMLHVARPNVSALNVEFEAIPKPAKPYDLAYFSMIYHDTVWMGVDRAKMDKAIFAALKPGGILIIVDHQAAKGAGATVTKSLHRIEQSVVEDELKAAGFTLGHPHTELANPADDHSKIVFDPSIRGKTDRFIIVAHKPM